MRSRTVGTLVVVPVTIHFGKISFTVHKVIAFCLEYRYLVLYQFYHITTLH